MVVRCGEKNDHHDEHVGMAPDGAQSVTSIYILYHPTTLITLIKDVFFVVMILVSSCVVIILTRVHPHFLPWDPQTLGTSPNRIHDQGTNHPKRPKTIQHGFIVDK